MEERITAVLWMAQHSLVCVCKRRVTVSIRFIFLLTLVTDVSVLGKPRTIDEAEQNDCIDKFNVDRIRCSVQIQMNTMKMNTSVNYVKQVRFVDVEI